MERYIKLFLFSKNSVFIRKEGGVFVHVCVSMCSVFNLIKITVR